MIYLELFLSFLQVGLFSIGGGYAAIPIIQSRVVDHYGWLSASEFADLLTIAEMTPGPMAVNSATFVGIRMAGVPGAIVSTLGCILPSCFIVSALAFIYYRFKKLEAMQSVLSSLRPAVIALIASAGVTILRGVVFDGAIALNNANVILALIFVAALFVLRRFKFNPVLVMLACGGVYLSINLVMRWIA